jgi:hypothetical protein
MEQNGCNDVYSNYHVYDGNKYIESDKPSSSLVTFLRYRKPRNLTLSRKPAISDFKSKSPKKSSK